MATVNNDEKRKHTRVGFATEIHILIDSEGQQIRLDGNSNNLSLTGLFVETRTRFSIQTKCLVNIYLTGGIDKIELSINATVVRDTGTGMGIEFDSMDVDTYSHLKNIVYYNSGGEAG